MRSLSRISTPKWLDQTLVGIIIFLGLFLGLFGQPLILTGQGNSMEGPRGLRDGAREFVLPLWLFFDIHQDGIYAFRAKEELWIKRASKIQGDYIWFLGDNQATDEDGSPESVDSREFGWIHRSQVIGIRVFSLPRIFDGPTETEMAQVASLERTPEEQAQIDATKDALGQGRAETEKARGLISEVSFLLGPTETRPLTKTVEIPNGSARVRWEATTAPLYPSTKILFSSLGISHEEEIPGDNSTKKGIMETPKGASEIIIKLKTESAVIVFLRFYSQ